jgi:hypothetical protein
VHFVNFNSSFLFASCTLPGLVATIATFKASLNFSSPIIFQPSYIKKTHTIFLIFQKGVGEITLSPHSVKQICVVKQPVGDVKKQLGQDVASISKWYLEAYQRINDVIVKNQILVAFFIGYLGDNISIPKICRRYFFQNLYQGRFFP